MEYYALIFFLLPCENLVAQPSHQQNDNNAIPATYTYVDLIEKVYDLESLAIPPSPGERSGSFTSHDRKSEYDFQTGKYLNWEANRDGDGFIREEPDGGRVFIENDEPLKLRVFIDKSVVEVFANGKQVLGVRVYPSRNDSMGVSLRSQGQDSELKKLEAWQMKSIYE